MNEASRRMENVRAGIAKLINQLEVMLAESGDTITASGFDVDKWLANWMNQPMPALGGRPLASTWIQSRGRTRYQDFSRGCRVVHLHEGPLVDRHELSALGRIADRTKQARPPVPNSCRKQTTPRQC
jgi:hypothetical protein